MFAILFFMLVLYNRDRDIFKKSPLCCPSFTDLFDFCVFVDLRFYLLVFFFTLTFQSLLCSITSMKQRPSLYSRRWLDSYRLYLCKRVASGGWVGGGRGIRIFHTTQKNATGRRWPLFSHWFWATVVDYGRSISIEIFRESEDNLHFFMADTIGKMVNNSWRFICCLNLPISFSHRLIICCGGCVGVG